MRKSPVTWWEKNQELLKCQEKGTHKWPSGWNSFCPRPEFIPWLETKSTQSHVVWQKKK